MCDTMRRLLLLFVGSMMVQLAEPRRHKHTNQPTELADPAIVVEGNHTLALFPTPCLRRCGPCLQLLGIERTVSTRCVARMAWKVVAPKMGGVHRTRVELVMTASCPPQRLLWIVLVL